MRMPTQFGPLVVLNQYDRIISHYDFENKILEVNLIESTFYEEVAVALLENCRKALVGDVKLKFISDGKSFGFFFVKLDRVIKIIESFGGELINKDDVLKSLKSKSDDKKKERSDLGKMKRFIDPKHVPKARLPLVVLDARYNDSKLSISIIIKNDISKLKMIDSFKLKSYVSNGLVSNLVREAQKEDKLFELQQKLSYIFKNSSKIDQQKYLGLGSIKGLNDTYFEPKQLFTLSNSVNYILED